MVNTYHVYVRIVPKSSCTYTYPTTLFSFPAAAAGAGAGEGADDGGGSDEDPLVEEGCVITEGGYTLLPEEDIPSRKEDASPAIL